MRMPIREGWFCGLVAAASILAVPLEARAQCGAALSQCRNCHEVQGAHPVQAGPWHRDHAFADFCAACHGGDPQATDEGTAHAGMIKPLTDPPGTCGACHGGESRDLAQRYVTAATPAIATLKPPTGPATHGRVAWPNVVLAAAILLLGAGGAAYAVRNERRLHARSEGGHE
jgi:hypothetical protein